MKRYTQIDQQSRGEPYTRLGREEAARVIKNFFEKRYNGHSQTIMNSLPLTDVVLAIDVGNEITCTDISSKTTIYSFPLDMEFVALREKSTNPPQCEVITFLYDGIKLVRTGIYHFSSQSKTKLEVLAKAAKKAHSIQEAIKETNGRYNYLTLEKKS